jgi:hypothetical protein
VLRHRIILTDETRGASRDDGCNHQKGVERRAVKNDNKVL